MSEEQSAQSSQQRLLALTVQEAVSGREARAESRPEPRLGGAQHVHCLETELLGTVSHELRSPLAAIKGYAATLLRHEQRLPSEERHEFLEAIKQACDRLQAAVDRLIEMSQLAAGAVQLESFPLDVARLAEDALFAAEQEAEQTAPGRFTFSMIREGGAPPGSGGEFLVNGDSRRLRRMLGDVLENAIKYSPDGGEIVVTARLLGEGATPSCCDLETSGLVEIEVRDRGIGIPREHLERIFDRFHRVDTRLTREDEGMGLGLAVAKCIVELHGGAIWAESSAGNGTAVCVRLPHASPSDQAN